MDTNSTKRSRRSFLRIVSSAAVAVPAACAASKFLQASPAFAQSTAPTKPVDAADPIAKALGYTSDASKVDTNAFPKRKGPEGEKQFCSNCMLLTKAGVHITGVEGEFGQCSVIASGLVNVKGWCNSWVQKPGAV